jgi:branched-chain amino acid transport system ATP-binding protein
MDLYPQNQREMGLTIIIIEHFMKVLTELTEKLLIIETGAMICCDVPEGATSDPRVIECISGDAYAERN